MNVNKFFQKWNKFWFSDTDTTVLSFLRIIFGMFLLLDFGTDAGIKSSGFYNSFHNQHYLLDLIPAQILGELEIFRIIVLTLSITFIIGLFTKYTSKILFVLLLFFYSTSQIFWESQSFLLLLIIGILSFSNCYSKYSFDSLLKKQSAKTQYIPIRLMQITLSIAYFFSLLWKLKAEWYTGETLEAYTAIGRINNPFFMQLVETFGYQFLSISLLFLLLFLSFAFWIPKIKYAAIVLGTLFHFLNLIFLGITFYGFEMVTLYILFLNTKTVQKIFSEVEQLIKT